MHIEWIRYEYHDNQLNLMDFILTMLYVLVMLKY